MVCERGAAEHGILPSYYAKATEEELFFMLWAWNRKDKAIYELRKEREAYFEGKDKK